MRKSKFRGKSTMSIEDMDMMGFEHDNGWVEGNLIQNGNKPWIVGSVVDSDWEYIAFDYWIRVHPESVGQYTGLTDKNGKEIYEGDVLTNNLYKNHNVAFKCYYEDKEAMYRLLPFKLKIDGKPIGTKDLSLQMDSVRRKEIIGNVFEDKHLLEATK